MSLTPCHRAICINQPYSYTIGAECPSPSETDLSLMALKIVTLVKSEHILMLRPFDPAAQCDSKRKTQFQKCLLSLRLIYEYLHTEDAQHASIVNRCAVRAMWIVYIFDARSVGKCVWVIATR